MKVKTAVVWWLIRGEEHPTLSKGDMTIKSLTPLVKAMFPGINYYSISGFTDVMQQLVVPALKARHGELKRKGASEVKGRDRVNVAEVLPSDGYEWQDSPSWKRRFRTILAG